VSAQTVRCYWSLRRPGRTARGGWCCSLMICWCAFAPPCLHRASINSVFWCFVVTRCASRARGASAREVCTGFVASAPAAVGDQLELPIGSDRNAEPSRRKRWSWMLAHVFLADLDTCARCGGPMRCQGLAPVRPQIQPRELSRFFQVESPMRVRDAVVSSSVVSPGKSAGLAPDQRVSKVLGRHTAAHWT
jgi:hypothetical protein